MSANATKHRWLMCGSFSATPDGRKRAVSGERFATVMQAVNVRVTASLSDSLGANAGTTVELRFDRPRKFRASEIIAEIEPLRRLWELATAVDQDRDITPSVVAARIEKIVGAGGLASRLGPSPSTRASDDRPPLPEPSEPTPPSAEPASPPSDDSPRDGVDAIFAKVEAPVGANAKNPLDAFIGAMRSNKPKVVRVDPEVARDLAGKIRGETIAAALAVLSDPAVAEIEAAWRGLRMVVAEAPGHDDLAIELLDVSAANLVEALEQHVHATDPLRPDAVFVGVDVPPAMIPRLAAVAEARGVPIVVGVTEASTGRVWFGDEDEAPLAEWSALRLQSEAGWLCAAANAVVLYNEDVGDVRRLVFGSPAWGMAAILSSSLKRTQTLRETVGRFSSVVSPGAVETDIGFGEPRTIPTRTYADLSRQRCAAGHGIVLLGSEPGSDQILVATNAMVAAGSSLVSRILSSAAQRS